MGGLPSTGRKPRLTLEGIGEEPWAMCSNAGDPSHGQPPAAIQPAHGLSERRSLRWRPGVGSIWWVPQCAKM